jgi:hypothetical protein
MKRSVLVGALTAAALSVSALLVFSQATVSPLAIASSVDRTPHMLEKAWRLPVAAMFDRFITYQTNASLCGPASLANTNRSFGDVATAVSQVLSGTGRCQTGYCILGLTLDELADVARANTIRKVTVLRDLTPKQFHEHMKRSNDPKRRYIINFSRAQIFGAGVGHHSPIGGYLADGDLVFVLDVNREYGPWLVQRSRLFAAMNTFDGRHKRGLLLIE